MRGIVLAAIAFILAAFLGLAFSSVSGSATSVLEGKIICVDPGHGGAESGATYQKRGRSGWTLIEKDINLDVAQSLRDLLQADGATVVMTRTNDSAVSLQQRVDICNAGVDDQAADIAVSTHTNSTFSPRWDGAMTLMNKDEDKPLAEAVQAVVYQGLAQDWDGRFTDYGINVDEWFIPKYTTMPAVILEPVFMSNRDEAAALRLPIEESPAGRRAQIAQAEYEGILAYFGP